MSNCFQCFAELRPGGDAAHVCIQCGGMNPRLHPSYCCPWCGAAVGYLGRGISWLVGTRTHGCAERRTAAASLPSAGSSGDGEDAS